MLTLPPSLQLFSAVFSFLKDLYPIVNASTGYNPAGAAPPAQYLPPHPSVPNFSIRLFATGTSLPTPPSSISSNFPPWEQQLGMSGLLHPQAYSQDLTQAHAQSPPFNAAAAQRAFIHIFNNCYPSAIASLNGQTGPMLPFPTSITLNALLRNIHLHFDLYEKAKAKLGPPK
ncbi:hypothetical protein JCM6882_007581 [Rhodosporidiobolus microsporus]